MRTAILIIAALSVACGESGPGEWVVEGGVRWREVDPHGHGGFDRLDASRHGIDFVYDVSDARRTENRILAEGAGVAIGDVDGDGLADLFFAGFGVPSRLFHNRGGWHFDDVTGASGIALDDVLVRGAALVDVDGDGDLDLVLTVHGAPNRLLLNDGTGTFEAVAGAGFEVARGSTTPALADIDGDGDLDLYIANYKTLQADDVLSDVQRGRLNQLRPGPDGRLEVPDFLAEHYRVDFDGRFVRWWELGETDELYLNEGGGHFRAVSLEDRFRQADGRPLTDPLRDWGLTARFSDWDGDGDADLYVANDFNSPDGIWLNQGEGTFAAAPATAIRTTSLSSMAVAVSDVDRDGDLDLLTTDMRARDRGRRLTQVTGFNPEPEPPGVIDTRIQENRNALQLNRGDGTFAEVAHEAGISASDWTWGALFLDADLDGFEDLLVTTGHVWNQLDGDTNQRILMAPPGTTDWRRTLSLFPSLEQANVAYRGLGDGTFEDVTREWSWGTEDDISHGLAAGDLDADGDLDVVVTRLGEPPLLMRNEAANPRVLVRLEGAPPNTRGIGARISAVGHPAGVQIEEIVAGGSYLSSSEAAVMFAVPEGGTLRITVAWPDGVRSVVDSVAGNREYVVGHPSGREASPTDGEAPAEAPGPLFSDASELLDHRHVEAEFDDRARQPMLPISLSRLGPGVSWLDVDGDGDADLLMGTGRGGSLALLRNRGGVFDAPRALTGALGTDATAILGHWRSDGRLDLLYGTSSYEAQTLEAAVAEPSLWQVGVGSGAGAPRGILEGSPSVTGPLAQADIDGDGDLDVFVGGRVIPTRVPEPADSRILINDDGVLAFDAIASAPFRRVGLVSGAVFTDIDADGDPDLALATTWGPVRLFRNDAGRFEEITDAVGLGALPGRWNAVTAADFDGDGRQDLVATGWGDNLDLPARYSMFHGDFDRDGRYDLIEAVRSPEGWFPIRGRDELERGLPSLGQVSFAAFRDATLEDLLGAAFDSTARVDIEELRHTVFLNRGDRFEAHPLPAVAQRAPALGIAAGDLDGDGSEDLVISQNYYAVRTGTPRYDAGRGLLLLGDGAGGFEAASGLESGIEVYGDGRGVAFADFDLDRRLDIAIGVNGASTRLFHNERGRPGLRVRLIGRAANPQAIGAAVWLVYPDGATGPAREVRSGEGYWSRNEATLTMGLRGTPALLRVRWPGGDVTEHPIGPQTTELTVRQTAR